jgi:hypothetical protein
MNGRSARDQDAQRGQTRVANLRPHAGQRRGDLNASCRFHSPSRIIAAPTPVDSAAAIANCIVMAGMETAWAPTGIAPSG